MFRIAAALLLVAFVAGCKPTAEEMNRVQGALPEGCTIIDLGKYGEIDRLVMIRCAGYDTVSTNTVESRRTGKTTTSYQSVAFTFDE